MRRSRRESGLGFHVTAARPTAREGVRGAHERATAETTKGNQSDPERPLVELA